MRKQINPAQWTLTNGFAIRSKDPELVERAIAVARTERRPRGRARLMTGSHDRVVEWMLAAVYNAWLRDSAPAAPPPPVFIALKAEYFDRFADGSKTDQLRLYGKRWNERTCLPGREVVLSRGFGKQQRLQGRIAAFRKQRGTEFSSSYRADIERVYGTLEVDIAVISITDLAPAPEENNSL